MKVAVLFSGGKDSTLALHKALKFQDVVCLVSLLSENPESYMFHVPNITMAFIQAEAIGLPIILKKTKGEKEKELADLKDALIDAKRDFGIEGVVTGAVRSVYQASRIQKICSELGLWCFNPLWLKDQIELLEEVVREGFEVIISGVFAYPLEKDILGRRIDRKFIGKMKKLQKEWKINPAGEGGEIETTVLDGPVFRKRIKILEHETTYRDSSGTFRIKGFSLVKK